MDEPVTFKGNREGIVMMLDCTVQFEELCQLIVQKLWQSRDFLGDHTSLMIHTGDHLLTEGEQLALKVLLQSLGHEIKRFIPETAEHPVSTIPKKTIEEAQMEEVREKKSLTRTRSHKPASSLVNTDFVGMEHFLAEGGLVIRKNIRSGQKIVFDGTLVILGDVNAGAELVASGHILVMGTLRGLAHAGCENNRDAIVYANNLQPVQLRIADFIARAPEGEVMEQQPEIARVIGQQLVIEEL